MKLSQKYIHFMALAHQKSETDIEADVGLVDWYDPCYSREKPLVKRA